MSQCRRDGVRGHRVLRRLFLIVRDKNCSLCYVKNSTGKDRIVIQRQYARAYGSLAIHSRSCGFFWKVDGGLQGLS